METAVSEDDEEARLTSGNEEKKAGNYFNPEKSYLSLVTEGMYGEAVSCGKINLWVKMQESQQPVQIGILIRRCL